VLFARSKQQVNTINICTQEIRMKKILVSIAGCAALLAFSSMAECAEGPYVGGNIGFAIPNDSDLSEPGVSGTIESETGYALGVVAGIDLGITRVDGEVAYQKNDLDTITLTIFGLGTASSSITGDISSLTFLVNGYYDFKNTSPLTPYVSAGFGFSRVEVSDISVPGIGPITASEDDTVFAYQVGAGVGYAITPELTIDAKYRYFGTSDPSFGGTEAEYSSHNFYGGLRVSF
jgi:opacity protein-like surface antigen